MQLVLSLFPGIDLLGNAFEEVGFCVVRGPDVLWGGDNRKFHPPPGRVDGVIAGPPCQMFSSLAHMVRQRGYQPKFGNLIPDFSRCVSEASPQWFLMENVPKAPDPEVEGYEVFDFLLNNRQCVDENGKPAEQNRVRKFWFGWRGERRVLMIDTTALAAFRFEYAACGGSTGSLANVDNRRSRKPNTVNELRGGKGRMPWNTRRAAGFAEVKRKQGLSEEYDLPPFTVAAKCQAVGNGVPLPMGRAIAKAVGEAVGMDIEE